ncbi:MAG: HAD family hydrolase [Oscillospiraceae bacterium]
MIKLVACDIDGTLLHTGETEISPKVFEQLERLHKMGVVFCAASGRQYCSLHRMFAKFADKMYYICNNGAVVYGPYSEEKGFGKVLSKSPLPRKSAEEICNYLLSKDYFEVMIGGESLEYIIPKSHDLSEHLSFIGYEYKKVLTPEEIPEDMIKVTAFCPRGAAERIEELSSRYSGKFNVSISGERWIDITVSNKGTGLSHLCGELNIPLGDAMAIGDNYNDLPMFALAGHPVVMKSAAPEIASQVSVSCNSVEEMLAQII